MGLCASRNIHKDIRLQITTMDPECIPFYLLQQITDNFSEERKLGTGTYGDVYKVRLWTCFLYTNLLGIGVANNAAAT